MITIAKLTDRLVPLSRRAVQLWADEGVLLPMAGTGPGTDAPRLFDDYELQIGKILRELIYSRTGTVTLKIIARHLRLPESRRAVARALNAEEAWLAIAVFQDPAFEPDCTIIAGDDIQTVAARAAKMMADCDVRFVDLTGRLNGRHGDGSPIQHHDARSAPVRQRKKKGGGDD